MLAELFAERICVKKPEKREKGAIFSKKSVEIKCGGETLYIPETLIEDLDVYQLQKQFEGPIEFDIPKEEFETIICADMYLRAGYMFGTRLPERPLKHAYKLGIKTIIHQDKRLIMNWINPLQLRVWNIDEMIVMLNENINDNHTGKKFLINLINEPDSKQKFRLIDSFLRKFFSTGKMLIQDYYHIELVNDEVHFIPTHLCFHFKKKNVLIREFIRNKIYLDIISRKETRTDSRDIKVPKCVLTNIHPYFLALWKLSSTNAVDSESNKCIIFRSDVDLFYVKYPGSKPQLISCVELQDYNYDRDISKPQFNFSEKVELEEEEEDY